MFTFKGATYYVQISAGGVKVVASSGGKFFTGGVTTVTGSGGIGIGGVHVQGESLKWSILLKIRIHFYNLGFT